MSETPAGVELKRVLNAIIFAAKEPVSIREIIKVLTEVAEGGAEGGGAALGKPKESAVKAALDELHSEWEKRVIGFHLTEVAGSYRFQSDPECGPWVRNLLNLGKPARLSRPALETLAIIAYRQPVARAEIEGVRGVAIDHILRLLMEMQLVKIIGRSNLPGRPLLYGTTALFLEHFGLKDVRELPGIEELARRSERQAQAPRGGEAEASAGDAGDGPEAGVMEPGTEEVADPGKQEGLDEPD